MGVYAVMRQRAWADDAPRPEGLSAWLGSQFKNNHFTKMCIGSEAGLYVRLIDSCITPLKAQGPSRTCNQSNEEEEEED